MTVIVTCNPEKLILIFHLRENLKSCPADETFLIDVSEKSFTLKSFGTTNWGRCNINPCINMCKTRNLTEIFRKKLLYFL
jgi:hypothetical protein